jgi:hypothetical protein
LNNNDTRDNSQFLAPTTSKTSSSFRRYLLPSLTLENNEVCTNNNTTSYRDGKIQYDFSNSKLESNNHDDDIVRVVVKNARIDWTQLLNVPFGSATRKKEIRKRNKVLNDKNKRRLSTPTSKDNRRERRRRFVQRIRQNWLPSNDATMDEENDNDDIEADDSSVMTMESTSSTSSSSSSFHPEEGAIHFEVSIAFHDRSYNAVRSLARIRQLYKELLESDSDSTIDDDSDSFDEEMKQNNEDEQPLPMDESDDTMPESSFGMDWVPNTRRERRLQRRSERQYDRRQQQKHDSKQERKNRRRRSSRIPALPDLFQGLSSISNLRLLYAQIQQNFVPAIESWFRTVFAVLTPKKSSTLTSFFWDPILLSSSSSSSSTTVSSNNKNTPRHQRPQLEIIPEEKYEQEE